MKIFKSKKKTIIITITTIIVIAAIFGAVRVHELYNNLEPYIQQQINATIKYMPAALTSYPYAELPPKVAAKGYEHTPEGQAKFYTDIIG